MNWTKLLALPLVAALCGSASATGLSYEFHPTASVDLDLGTHSLGALGSDVSPGALALLQNDDPDVPSSLADEAPTPAYTDKGSNWWYVHGGFAMDIKSSENKLFLGGVGWSHFFVNRMSLNLELNAIGVAQKGKDAVGINFNVLLRWHFFIQDTWSLYLEGGAGMLGTTNEVPRNGTAFNFTPQCGIGFTKALRDDMRLILGAKWQHISNASLSSSNPGRDSVMGYVGVSFPF
jgi:hypothetical protein